MKKLLFLLTLVATLAAFSPLAEAKDKDRKKEEERDKKRWKETRDDVRELREQYSRLAETLQREGGSHRLREQIRHIGADVQHISAQFERGSFDSRELRDRIAQADDSINRARQQIDSDRAQANRRYSRDDDDRRGYDRRDYDRDRSYRGRDRD